MKHKAVTGILLTLLATSTLFSLFNIASLAASSQSKDVLIIDDINKRAFFGWYRASQMPSTGWDLLQRTVDWADGFIDPSQTDIVLFTYDGTLDPETDDDGYAVYTYLTGKGYVNITVHSEGEADDLPPSYYVDFDLVIYWDIPYAYGPTNIIDAGVPFITVAWSHTDEMGIGTGASTMHERRDVFYVVNNAYYPTQTYPLDILTFESKMWTDATEATGSGIVLVKTTFFPPVGGIWIPVDKLALLAPYIALASTILVATAAAAIYVKRVKRRKKK